MKRVALLLIATPLFADESAVTLAPVVVTVFTADDLRASLAALTATGNSSSPSKTS